MSESDLPCVLLLMMLMIFFNECKMMMIELKNYDRRTSFFIFIVLNKRASICRSFVLHFKCMLAKLMPTKKSQLDDMTYDVQMLKENIRLLRINYSQKANNLFVFCELLVRSLRIIYSQQMTKLFAENEPKIRLLRIIYSLFVFVTSDFNDCKATKICTRDSECANK